MKTLYLYLAAALALVALIGSAVMGVHHYGAARYTAGVDDGRAAVMSDNAAAAANLYAQHDALERFSSLAGSALATTLATDLPAIEGQAHDTVETIRTIYRDRPVPADTCTRPDSVQQALNAAVQRANATAHSQLRPDAATGADPVRAGAAGGR